MRFLKIKNVLIDLQGTISDDKSLNHYCKDQNLRGNFMAGVLRDILVKKYNLSPKEALSEMEKIGFPEGRPSKWLDPFYILLHGKFDISEDEYWEELLKWCKKHVLIYEDARWLIENLSQKGYSLYLVSNCLKNMVIAELKSHNLIGYFKGIYGLFDLGVQKDNPVAYQLVFEREKINPSESVMIGDDFQIDCVSASKAGISLCIIVNRSSEKKVMKIGNHYSVADLKYALELIDR